MKVLMAVYKVEGQPLGNRPGNVARALDTGGHKVTAVKFDWREEVPSTQQTNNVQVDTIHYSGITSKIWTTIGLPYLYAKLIPYIKRESPDAIYCEHPFLLPFAVFAGRQTGSKVVYDAYDMFSKQAIGDDRPRLKAVMENIENAFVSQVDYVLTIDSRDGFLAERYRRYSEVQVLYNVPRLSREAKAPKTKGSVDIPHLENRPVLAYAGGIFRGKGSIKMVEALDRLVCKFPDVLLVYMGSYKDDSEAVVNEIVQERDLEKNFEYLGFLPYNEMLEILRAASVGLCLYQPVGHYPDAGKGQARKFFTYMQAGLPIVGPDFGEIGEVVDEVGCGRRVDPTDTDKVTQAIADLLENPQRSIELGKRGREAVEDRYNWEQESQKLLDIFERLE